MALLGVYNGTPNNIIYNVARQQTNRPKDALMRYPINDPGVVSLSTPPNYAQVV